MNLDAAREAARQADGRFGEQPHTTPEVHLPVGSAFQELRDNPENADFEETFDTILADISNDSFPRGPNSWDAVVGPGARRTAANKEKYRRHIARVAGNDPVYREKHKSYAAVHAQLESYARAYERGIDIDPRTEAYFESVWEDPESSFGEVGTREELRRVEDLERGLSEGTVKPSQVVGTGLRNPRKQAEAWLEHRRRQLKRALATRGRSNSAIARNALYRERRYES